LIFLLREDLGSPEPEEKGAVSGEEARPPEKKGWFDELEEVVEEVVEEVPMLEAAVLFRRMVFSKRASTSLKLRFSWPC